MEADTTRASLPSRNQIVDAFVNAEISNSDFLDLFSLTPLREGHPALLRCRSKYLALAGHAKPANALDASEDTVAQWIHERDLLQD